MQLSHRPNESIAYDVNLFTSVVNFSSSPQFSDMMPWESRSWRVTAKVSLNVNNSMVNTAGQLYLEVRLAVSLISYFTLSFCSTYVFFLSHSIAM